MLGAEEVAISTTAQSLATHGATIPAGTTEMLVVPQASGALHHHPTGTPSTTFGHAVAALEPFVLEHHQLASKVAADSGTPNVVLVYLG